MKNAANLKSLIAVPRRASQQNPAKALKKSLSKIEVQQEMHKGHLILES
jgi:hypothetical protein